MTHSFFLLSYEMMKEIGTIRYSSSVQGKIFMTVFFALSVLVGITIIISEELADTSTVGILWIIVSCVVYMILHEGLHLFFMRMFSKKKLRISFVFPAVSGGDFMQIFHVMRYPQDALFQDRGDETAIYSSAEDLSTPQTEPTT